MKISPIASLYTNSTTFGCKKPLAFSGLRSNTNDIYTRQKFCPDEVINKYAKLQKEGKTQQILSDFGIKSKTTNGKMVLSHYCQPKDYTFKQAGINEDKLLKDVVGIMGNADFTNSAVTNLSKLKKVGGHLKAENHPSDINLSSLEKVGTNIDICYSNITSMSNLKEIGGWAHLDGAKLNNLDSLESVGNWLSLSGTRVKELPSIQSIGSDMSPSDFMSADTIAQVNAKCLRLNRAFAIL